MPTCWIVAGPNGAGKTTFALHYLLQVAKCRNFINADLIAAGLSPLAPAQQQVAAGRLLLRSLRHLLHDFSHRVDRCDCYLNIGVAMQPVFSQTGTTRPVHHAGHYSHLVQESQT